MVLNVSALGTTMLLILKLYLKSFESQLFTLFFLTVLMEHFAFSGVPYTLFQICHAKSELFFCVNS